MASNQVELNFDEDAEDVVVEFLNNVNGTSSVAATNLDFREYGVFIDYTASSNHYRVFVPWSNVAGLKQYLGV